MKRSGYTLVELIVVLFIMAIIITFVIQGVKNFKQEKPYEIPPYETGTNTPSYNP